MDVSTTKAINQGLKQLQTKLKEIYVPQISKLLARPRTKSNKDRRSIDTRKIHIKVNKDIAQLSKMLQAELRRRGSSASSDYRDGPSARRYRERTQAMADSLDQEVQDYLRLMDDALNDVSDDETLVNSSDEEEQYEVLALRARAGNLAQGRTNQSDGQGEPRRTVRFAHDATPIMPTAEQLDRVVSQSRAQSAAPQPRNTRAVDQEPTSTHRTQHEANQGRPRTSRRVIIRDDSCSPEPERPTAMPSTTHMPPAYHGARPDAHHYRSPHGQRHSVAQHSTHETRGHNESPRRVYMNTDPHDTNTAYAHRGPGPDAAHRYSSQVVYGPSPHANQAPRTTSHREKVYSKFEHLMTQTPEQPGQDHQQAPRTPSRFPSLQGLRGSQPGPIEAPNRAFQQNPLTWHASDDYSPPSGRREQPNVQMPPSTQHACHDPYCRNQSAPRRAPSAERYQHHYRQRHAEYEEVHMLSAMQLSESEIMNDTTA
ncbi:hypothetical protein PMZ80_007335 [Knufia obscura]|uniref:Uncharacterized protein n=2 Tax=Knufia TaxID=430999 RepID=A0AAN8ERD7_9EURO|nr:hypothetical protein PMZ80_007335 [Knufia obscura]KAK5950578.1 hypothetical protein OHC33_008521 [Knufia fluminis]